MTAVLGLIAGFGIALGRLGMCPGHPDPTRVGAAAPAEVPTEIRSKPSDPKVVVDGETYDFGVMDSGDSGSHDFLFTNEGGAALSLEEGESTCKCTGVEMEKPEVLPGETVKVTVKWTGKGSFGPFTHGVTITTNDPNWPQVGLTITGRVTAAVRAAPGELVFSRITAGETVSATAKIFGYLPDPMEISGYEFENPDTAEHFGVTFVPLASDQVEEEPEATAGYHVEVTVNPGLPAGPFRQTILFKTSLEKHPTVGLPVKGMIGSEISVVARGWSEEHGVLTIGTVNSLEGEERTLLLVIRGPHRKDIQFKLIEVFPDIFEVDEEALGRTVEMSSGVVNQTQLKIRIPPGSRPANHLGTDQGRLGRITIGTTHPDVPQLTIYIRFAVEG